MQFFILDIEETQLQQEQSRQLKMKEPWLDKTEGTTQLKLT